MIEFDKLNKEEKLALLKELEDKSVKLKQQADYYNAMQLALKLVLNGSYGAFAAKYFVLFNENVAGTITSHGRELIQTMDKANEFYWKNTWHNDVELHKKMSIRNVIPIKTGKKAPSVYCDTDSLFVSFEFAMNSCEWKNLAFDNIDKFKSNIIIIGNVDEYEFDRKSSNIINVFNSLNSFLEYSKENDINNVQTFIISGGFVKNRDMKKVYDIIGNKKIFWNWGNEIEFIEGLDEFRIGNYFIDKLEEYANSYGVENKEDFELERISEGIISIAKKKYIMHTLKEDGIDYGRLQYIYPKGVELIRSSTPLFAREKIVDIIKYLFDNSDTFNIKELVKLVKDLRKEFELADIDDISMQSSVSNYDEKVIEYVDKLSFVNGTHFSVKASAYYNHLLHHNRPLQNKYDFIKSGTKIKYYYTLDTSVNKIFAYSRGSYPIEFAPQVNYDLQFYKCIISPINSIIAPIGLPQITKRLSVILDIFGGFNMDEDDINIDDELYDDGIDDDNLILDRDEYYIPEYDDYVEMDDII